MSNDLLLEDLSEVRRRLVSTVHAARLRRQVWVELSVDTVVRAIALLHELEAELNDERLF